MFRKEVADAKAYRLLGKVALIQPTSTYLIICTVMIFFFTVATFITQASYSRKETVRGYIIPKSGVIKIFANRTGVVDIFYVQEGSKVRQGEKLLKIRNNHNLSTGEELSTKLILELKKQIRTLQQEYDAITVLGDKELARLSHQIIELKRKTKIIEKAIKINNRRLSLKKEKITKNEKLLQKNYISIDQFATIEEELLEVLSEENRLDRELVNANAEIGLLSYDISDQPEQILLKKVEIMRKISALKSQITEVSESFEFIQVAPEAGIVTGIQSVAGDRVHNDMLLLNVIPEHSPLEMEMLLPTRSAGFVKNGDVVNIRFDAFPYQKFGFTSGRVINIDKTILLSSDKIFPIPINEAVYRVRAIIDKQAITAYGKSFPLKIGMLADVDIILERRSLIEWLLDPIYAVKGKI